MVKWQDKSIHFKQERRIIDGTKWWAYELHDEFLKKIRWEFTDAQAEKLMTSWFVQIKHLSHIPENIVNALKQWKQTTVDGYTTTIEVTIEDQLIGLLYDRRTDLNNSEITYFIFQEQLQKLKKQILKKTAQ
jgi:hypothetical protein